MNSATKIDMSSSKYLPMPSSHYLLLSSDLLDSSSSSSSMDNNHSLSTYVPFFAFNDIWVLPLLILCLIGLMLTIIIAFCFIWLSFRRFNGHFILTNLFICFGVCLLYFIVIIFLIRGNEFMCGLREFLSQFGYALLYSALLCRYILQWLGSRILSKRTKQLTALLIYFLLVCVQIPIGILWWYFTVPRACQHQTIVSSSSSRWPKLAFQLRSSSIRTPCSNRCIVDYRFYATYTYTIVQLFICTIIASCLFLCRHCGTTSQNSLKDKNERKSKQKQEKNVSSNGGSACLTFLNMLAFILIDLAWLAWTFIYHFSQPFFVFPALVCGMFIIATLCLFLILIPQLYFYFQTKISTHTNGFVALKPIKNNLSTTLYSNKLASVDDVDERDDDPPDLLLQRHIQSNENIEQRKKSHHNQKKQQQTLSNGSEQSYELGASGTFLPITRTPKGPFKITGTEQLTSTPGEKLDKLIYGEHRSAAVGASTQDGSVGANGIKVNASPIDIHGQQEQQVEHRLPPPMAPLQRQMTSSSIASDFVTPVSTGHITYRPDLYHNHSSDIRSSSSMYNSPWKQEQQQCPRPRRDETIIPILCTTERPRTSTPVQMRILVNSPSSSVPTTRRIHSGTDLRYLRHPYYHPQPPPSTPSYYPQHQQEQEHQYLYIDPYRTMPSRLGGNTWHSVLLQPGMAAHRYPYPYRRLNTDGRSLSQRLWDIDSGDDEVEEDVVLSRSTPTADRLNDFRSSHPINDDNILLHIDDDADEDDSYGKQYVQV